MTAIADRPIAAPEPAPATAAVASTVPIATLSINLLPDEILVKRRLAFLQRRLVFVVVALVALVVLGDLLVRQQTRSAEEGLAGASNHISALTKQLNQFNGVLQTQSETQAIWSQLDTVMTNDVAWPTLLARLTRPEPAGLKLTSVAAQVQDANSADTATTVDPSVPTGSNDIGTLTLSGTAPSWRAVATYVRGLSATPGFAAVNPSTVSNAAAGPGAKQASSLTFTITVDLTSGVLSNRYATASSATTASAASTQPVDSQTAGSTAGNAIQSPASGAGSSTLPVTTRHTTSAATQHETAAPGDTARQTHRTKHRKTTSAGGRSARLPAIQEAN